MPVAGFPRLDDIPTTAFSYDDLVGSNIINALDDGDLIWVAKDKDTKWNVYQLNAIPAKLIQTDDINTGFTEDEITLFTDVPHGLIKDQIISIKNFSEDVDNVYIIKEILSTTSFKVSGGDARGRVDDSATGQILEFNSTRVSQPDNINDIKNVSKITPGTLVYADDDGTGKWAVYEKINAFTENKWGAPNEAVNQTFGSQIVTANAGRTIVVSAPTFGDEGQVYVLNREFNTNISTLSATQGFAVSFNASDNIITGNGLGTSLAISNDGTVLVAGSPKASNFKATDDSSREGFRVSVGDFTVDADTFTREGVVTLHTYNTADNVFKLNYIIGSSDPQDDAHFGASVLVSNNKLIVGAPGYNSKQGKVFIYDKVVQADGSTLDWELSKYHTLDIPNSRDGDSFGTAMAGNKDLSLIAITAPGVELVGDDSSSNKGAVYIYKLVSNDYQLVQTISSSTFSEIKAGDQFGYAVAMNEDANTLIISAPFNDSGNINSGAVYYFNRTSSDSSVEQYTYQQTILSPQTELEEKFGGNMAEML